MPNILHDGPRNWNVFTARKSGATLEDFTDFLHDYYNSTDDQVPVLALETWREVATTMLQTLKEGESPLNVVGKLRSSVSPGHTSKDAENTIFISHQKADTGRAKMLAKHIIKTGRFDVWLECWEPALSAFKEFDLEQAQQSLIIAMMIEMGMLNSRATLTILTGSAAESSWVPFAYGRHYANGHDRRMLGYIWPPESSSIPDCVDLGEVVRHNDGMRIPPELSAWLHRL